MRQLAVSALVAASLSVISLSEVVADQLDYLIGTWTATSEGRDLGQPVTFKRSFVGYDVILPFFQGESSLNISNGEYSSHVKITSVDNESCFYRINKISALKFTIALRHSGSTSCPTSAVFEKVIEEPANNLNIQNNDAVNTNSESLDTSFFKVGPSVDDNPREFESNYDGEWGSDDIGVYFVINGKMFNQDTKVYIYTDSSKTEIKRFSYYTYSSWRRGDTHSKLTDVRNFCERAPSKYAGQLSEQLGSLINKDGPKTTSKQTECKDDARKCAEWRKTTSFNFSNWQYASVKSNLYSDSNDYGKGYTLVSVLCQVVLIIPKIGDHK